MHLLLPQFWHPFRPPHSCARGRKPAVRPGSRKLLPEQQSSKPPPLLPGWPPGAFPRTCPSPVLQKAPSAWKIPAKYPQVPHPPGPQSTCPQPGPEPRVPGQPLPGCRLKMLFLQAPAGPAGGRKDPARPSAGRKTALPSAAPASRAPPGCLLSAPGTCTSCRRLRPAPLPCVCSPAAHRRRSGIPKKRRPQNTRAAALRLRHARPDTLYAAARLPLPAVPA